MTAFAHRLGLDLRFVPQLEQIGFSLPRPIQEAAIPALSAGRDVIGLAQTGSGKTAAYCLPIINGLLELPRDSARIPYALIIVPVRELTVQVAHEFTRLAPPEMGLRVVSLYGQMKRRTALVDGQPPDIVVATPGKLLDFQRQGLVDTRHLRYLVLDEFDRTLANQSFALDLAEMLRQNFVPPLGERVTALFSATMTSGLRKVMAQWVQNPTELHAGEEQALVEITHSALQTNGSSGVTALSALLTQRGTSASRTLVFCNSTERTEELAHRLRLIAIDCAAVHGKLPQSERLGRLKRLRSGDLPVVVCSDVFGRGIDISGLDLVVNYDVPDLAATYKHRSGRTGRAGNYGEAITIVRSPRDAERLRSFARELGIALQFRELTADTPVPHHPHVNLSAPLSESVVVFRHGHLVCPDRGKDLALLSILERCGSSHQVRVHVKNQKTLDQLATLLTESSIAYNSLRGNIWELSLAERISEYRRKLPGVWLISDEFLAHTDLAQHILPSSDAMLVGYELPSTTPMYLARVGGPAHVAVSGSYLHLVHETELFSLSLLRKAIGVPLETASESWPSPSTKV